MICVEAPRHFVLVKAILELGEDQRADNNILLALLDPLRPSCPFGGEETSLPKTPDKRGLVPLPRAASYPSSMHFDGVSKALIGKVRELRQGGTSTVRLKRSGSRREAIGTRMKSA